jgi:hypothetical protein
VRVEELEVNKKYIFFYPLKSTPNFLINLGDLNGRPVSVRVQVHSTMAPRTRSLSFLDNKVDL